ncbi:hypothetical protein vseg_021410 [Gypsophila vaccaria]
MADDNHPLSTASAAAADEDDLDEDDVVSSQSYSDAADDDDDPSISSDDAAVTVALTPPPPSSAAASAAAAPVVERKPIDDSRRLFQRLWTDEDEIELLRGFLEYTTARGGASAAGHHHDTAAFYDQIKNRLQLEFNKNQLVEKLRRLKKKYRNVLSKMNNNNNNNNNNKEFVFKSPHDQATFEISSKIWSNLSASFRSSTANRPSVGGAGAVVIAEFDDNDDKNPNPNANANYNYNYNCNPVTVAAATPPRPPNSSYVISHINLNSATPGAGSGSGGGFDMSLMNSSAALSKLSTRKKQRIVKTESGTIHQNNNTASNNNVNNNNNNNNVNNIGVSTSLQRLVEETVRNSLSPVLKDLINSATLGASIPTPGGVESPGLKGVGALTMNVVPLNYAGLKGRGGTSEDAGMMDEKWRKQQIMELEVYSKRLELVQDQIKLSLEELRSMES